VEQGPRPEPMVGGAPNCDYEELKQISGVL
jgi:hypothetical protein